jgi:undecaprenyl diphosphate synthase
MDGNGRWATRGFCRVWRATRQGVDVAAPLCAPACSGAWRVLTVFAFSSENWNRPADEVSGLMELLAMALSREVPQLNQGRRPLRFVGERAGLSARCARAWRRPRPRRRPTRAVAQRLLQLRRPLGHCPGGSAGARGEAITEASLDRAWRLAHVPDPDLVIRTGGEQRISNFLLWQAAYPSCISATTCGPISTKRRWTRHCRLQPA